MNNSHNIICITIQSHHIINADMSYINYYKVIIKRKKALFKDIYHSIKHKKLIIMISYERNTIIINDAEKNLSMQIIFLIYALQRNRF